MTDNYKEVIAKLQEDANKIQHHLLQMKSSTSKSSGVIEREIDDYMCEVETLCIRSRILLDGYRQVDVVSDCYTTDKSVAKIAGSVEETRDGWLHITLNTLLPNCRYKTSGYIGDTVNRLLNDYKYELPFFDEAFLAIVEYCNYEKHNALDNDNKGWKMIPNVLKGKVISDDSQFILSIGLFSKISDDVRCEIYVMPPEESSIFMDLLSRDEL